MHILHIQYRTTRHNIVYDDHDGSIEVTRYLRTSIYVYCLWFDLIQVTTIGKYHIIACITYIDTYIDTVQHNIISFMMILMISLKLHDR